MHFEMHWRFHLLRELCGDNHATGGLKAKLQLHSSVKFMHVCNLRLGAVFPREPLKAAEADQRKL